MYQLRRITTEPNTALKILVDHAQGDGDAGFLAGGSFFFEPAGKEGDRHQVNGHAAQVIMGDPGLAVHFDCTPPLPGTESKAAAAPKAAPKPAAASPAQDGPAAPAAAKGRRKKGKAGQAGD